MASTALDLIEQQRAKVAAMELALQAERLRLEGMESMFATMPARRGSTSIAPRATGEPKVGGRQKGAISQKWRDVLRAHYLAPDPAFTPEQVAETVFRLEGRTIKPSEARRILEDHERHGLVEKREGKLRVTPYAAEKFGFGPRVAPPPPPPLPKVEGPNPFTLPTPTLMLTPKSSLPPTPAPPLSFAASAIEAESRSAADALLTPIASGQIRPELISSTAPPLPVITAAMIDPATALGTRTAPTAPPPPEWGKR